MLERFAAALRDVGNVNKTEDLLSLVYFFYGV